MHKVIRGISNIPQWVFENVLNPRQREYVKGLLSERQKDVLKKVLLNGKRQKAIRDVDFLRHRLYSLGFNKRAYQDLIKICEKGNDTYKTKLAAWQLALWHANKYNIKDAELSLYYLSLAMQEEKDKTKRRQALIIKAESYKHLGKINEAKAEILNAIKNDQHPDLYLALANLECDMDKKVCWINKIYESYNLSNIEVERTERAISPYDRLINEEKIAITENTKVSIIVPAYNDEDLISTALDSILNQTWKNIEVIVVDDHSTDKTSHVVKSYIERDPRVKLISGECNRGAYVSRNLALNEATGSFVTINDSDDWSHQEKIQIQVTHLLKNPSVIGNTSQQARATNELDFYRRGKPGQYIFSNMSSFMFRREAVINAIGYWDSVRFGADSEFIKRIKIVFGKRAIIDLETGPLSFQRQSNTSLTGNSAFGFPGYFMGARKEYTEAHEYYHSKTKDYYYNFPQRIRPFSVPEPMLPKRKKNKGKYRFIDFLLVSDFRLSDLEFKELNIEIIRKKVASGKNVGLIQMSTYDYHPKESIDSEIRELIDGENVQMVVFGEKVSCNTLVLTNPLVLQESQRFIPDVHAKNVNAIFVEPFLFSEEKKDDIDIKLWDKRLEEHFGKGVWYFFNTLVLDNLNKYYKSDIMNINISDEEWDKAVDD